MSRRRLLLVALAPAALVGCHRMMTAKETPPAAAMPSPVTTATSPAARSAAPDDRRPIRDRIEQRRDERRAAADAPPAKPTAPTTPPAAPVRSDDLEPVRKLYRVAAERFDRLSDFEAHLTRREVVKNIQGPTEEVQFRYRKQPLSIHMTSIVPPRADGKPMTAREVLYVQGKFDNKMHVLIGDAEANFLMKAGSVQKFDPDSGLVTSRSRKRIYEAGFGDALMKFGKLIEATASGQRPNGVRSLGAVTRKEYPYPLEGIVAELQPGDDPLLPKGGRKEAYFDMRPESPGYGVPVIVVTFDADGREVEYYCFDRFRMPANFTDADFTPERLGKR